MLNFSSFPFVHFLVCIVSVRAIFCFQFCSGRKNFQAWFISKIVKDSNQIPMICMVIIYR
jgi:hypothetical protein